jgi:hypothetical protein
MLGICLDSTGIEKVTEKYETVLDPTRDTTDRFRLVCRNDNGSVRFMSEAFPLGLVTDRYRDIVSNFAWALVLDFQAELIGTRSPAVAGWIARAGRQGISKGLNTQDEWERTVRALRDGFTQEQNQLFDLYAYMY